MGSPMTTATLPELTTDVGERHPAVLRTERPDSCPTVPWRTITSIHHAERPAEGESGTEQHHQYAGEGQYVLEVNYGWTTARGIEVGDIVTFDL